VTTSSSDVSRVVLLEREDVRRVSDSLQRTDARVRDDLAVDSEVLARPATSAFSAALRG
jgi:hypothetical protein